MLFLVAALLIWGIIAGAAAQLPLPVTLVAASVITVWLLSFAARERRRARRDGR